MLGKTIIEYRSFYGSEYSNATTSQVLNSKSNDWDEDLLNILKIDKNIFKKPLLPGTVLGPLLASIQQETALPDIPLILPASHDTGSAVAAEAEEFFMRTGLL